MQSGNMSYVSMLASLIFYLRRVYLAGWCDSVKKVLVSACMMGQKVRYNASDVKTDDDLLEQWRQEGRLVTFCPELAGGFPVPRPPAEIESGSGGDAVLDAGVRVLEDSGGNVTRYFRRGAELTLEMAKSHGVKLAILKRLV